MGCRRAPLLQHFWRYPLDLVLFSQQSFTVSITFCTLFHTLFPFVDTWNDRYDLHSFLLVSTCGAGLWVGGSLLIFFFLGLNLASMQDMVLLYSFSLNGSARSYMKGFKGALANVTLCLGWVKGMDGPWDG
jgi:hypothetical protein